MIDELPAAPDPATDSPAVFSQKAAATVLAQKNMIPQINAALSGINSLAAGGAYALGYTFDTATADADPGAGKLRLDNAVQNTATTLRLDTTVGGQDYTSVIDTFDDSTSAIKGTIRLVKMGDTSKWMLFNVTAMASPTGYRNLSVTCIGSSSASPFVNGDGVMLHFQRTGDQGAFGSGALVLLGSAIVGTAVANINFLNIFTSAYDKYVIDIQGAKPSAASNFLSLRVAIGGVASSSTNYQFGTVDGTVMGAAGTTFPLSAAASGSSQESTLRVDIGNVNDSAIAKLITAFGYFTNATPAYVPVIRSGAYNAGSQILSGFTLFWSAGANFSSGTVRVYGIKNS